MSRRIFAVVTLAAVGAVASLFALTPVSVSGTVTASHNNQPLAGVQINVYDAAGDWVGSNQTDANGDYTLAGLPEGTYYLGTWNSQGYVEQAWNGLICAGCWPPQTGTPLVVPAGGRTDIDFALALGGRLRGRVTNAAGNPLPDISVHVYSQAGSYAGSGYTDANGDYLTTALPDGSYRLRTYNTQGFLDEAFNNLPCYSCAPDIGALVSVAGPAVPGSLDFVLEPGGQFTGRVTDAGNQPIAGVSITVLDLAGTVVGGGHTDVNGVYLTSSVPTGSYRLRTWNSSGYIDEAYNNIVCVNCAPTTGEAWPMAVPATTGNLDFSLAQGGQIRATVTADAGGPLPGVHVQIYNASGLPLAGQPTNMNGVADDGRGLPAGTYYVATYNTLGYVDEVYGLGPCLNCQPTLGTPIVVTVGNTTDIAMSLGLGNRISGRVTSSTGTTLAGLWVHADVVNGGRGAHTGADGTYQITGLPDGTYHLRTFNTLGYVDQVYGGTECGNCPPQSGTPIVLAGTTTFAGADFVLNRGGAIGGIVTDAGGLPLAGVSVWAYDSMGQWNGSAITDGGGSYVIANLRAASYFVRTSNSLGYVDELHANIACSNCAVTNGTAVAVPVGGTAFVNFSLTQGGTIAGVVTDGTGSPLPSIPVHVFAVGNPTVPVAFAFTNASGQYATTAGLPAGQYFLRTFNNSGYVDELFDNVACVPGCTNTDGTPVTVTPGGQTVANFSLVQGGRIAGTVTGANGPLAGVNVTIYSAAGVMLNGANTDAAGQYQFNLTLPPAQYFVRTFSAPGHIDELYNDIPCAPSCTVTAGTPVTVTAGGTASANFSLTQGGTIRGVITDAAANPVPSVSVSVYAVTNLNMPIAYASSDAAGQYATLSPLPAGQYLLRTFNNAGYFDEVFDNIVCSPGCAIGDGTPVTVTPGGQTVANFSLVQGGRISGTVTGASGPLTGVHVSIYTAAGVSIAGTTTNAAGQYQVFNTLAPGQYFVRTFSAPGHINELYNDIPCVPSCTITAGTPVTVTAGGTATADFALTASAAIEGTVTAVGGAPLSGISAQLYSSGGAFISSINTDANGFYRMATDLAAGTYYLRTFNSAGYLNEVWNNVACHPFCTVTTGTPIVLGAGATAIANFELTQGMAISGTVTRSDTSAPVNSVSVQVMNAAGQFVAGTSTTTSGQYSVVVVPGTYYVRTFVQSATGLIDQLHSGLQCAPSCTTTLGTPVSGPSTINFVLHPQAVLTGRVTDGTNGLNGVTVTAYSTTGAFLRSATTTTVAGLTGVYTIDRLAAGSVLVRTQNNAGFLDEAHDNILCGNSCAIATVGATPVAVASGATTTINFALARLGSITGVVTDAGTGLPIVGAQVRAFNSAGVQTFAGTITDATGAYTLQGVQTGTYYVQALSGNPAFPAAFGYVAEMYNDVECAGCNPLLGAPVAVVVGSVTPGIHFALNRGTQISGEVRVGGTPAISGTVNFFNSLGRFVGSTTVGAAGTFVSRDGFPAGTFYARAASTGGLQELYDNIPCFPSCASTAGTPIVTPGGGVPVTGINFDLTVGGLIAGTVLRDGASAPGGTSVVFVDALGRTVGSAPVNTTTGVYQSPALATGQYWAVTSNNNGIVNQVYGGGTCLGCDVRAQGTPLNVAAGSTTSGIDFNLTAGGRFAGTVTSTSGALLQGITVQVVTGITVVSQTTTTSFGTFTTGAGLPAGTYTLRTLNNLGYSNTQQNADIVGTATTSGLVFQLGADLDSDGDGIFNSIDRVAATGADESATPSNQFSDVIPGGFTSGAISDRGGWGVAVADQVLGVRLDVSGAGTSPVTVDTCAQGGAEQLRMASGGDAVGVTCSPTNGSTSVRVFQSTGIVELRKTTAGVTTVIQLTTGQGVTFGSPVTADSDNPSPVVVRFFNDAGDEVGSLTLAPGESADTSVEADGTLTVSVLIGNVTMTVAGETVTVYQGTSANFTLPTTTVTPARMRAQGHWDQAAKQKLHLVFDGRVDTNGAGSGSLAVWATGGGKPFGRFESTSVSSATFTPAGAGGTMVMTGAGAIGKQTGFTFAITVTDGGAGQDTVSVTVTNAQGVVIYQGSGPLAGGSVQSSR